MCFCFLPGTVFGDINEDGIQQPNEPSLANVEVQVEHLDNMTVYRRLLYSEKRIFTDIHGNYAVFVDAGEILATVMVDTLPSGWNRNPYFPSVDHHGCP